MKKEIDSDGRIIYKFSSSVSKGGNVYIRKTKDNIAITNKEGLRNCLMAICKKYDLIDPTIKIYDKIFFLFFHIPKLLTPAELIEKIEEMLLNFGEWDKECLYTGVYDLQEKYLRKDMEKWGYEYEQG